jgi:esterase/lipase
MFYKIKLTIACFSYSIILLAQKEDTIIEKNGFQKINIISKKMNIPFLTISQNIKTKKPTILFLQGSMPIPTILKDSSGASTSIIPFQINSYLEKFNFVIIPRYGIPIIGSYEKDTNGYLDKNGKPPLEFIKNDNLKFRTFQAKTVLDYLYKQKWVQKDSIYVIGHSEGYRVAAKLATKTNKISKIICMSADPFNRTAEMVFRERINCFNNENDSVSQSEIESLIESFKSIGSNIEKYKDDYDLYNWMSYERDMPYKNFKKIKNPILIVYGTNDIPSTHNDLIPYLLKQNNILLKAFPDYDHNYFKKEFDKSGNAIGVTNHWGDVMDYCIKWLFLKQ